MSTWLGIMMPISTNQKNAWRQRNRMRDSANAARLAVMTVANEVSAEVMKLDAYQLRMSPWDSRVRNDARVGCSMSQVGFALRSEEHTSELQSHVNLVCRL